jgi:hypothetical protein
MRTRRKNENRSDWRLTMEHIGRELQKLYPPADMPSGWHALFREQRTRQRAQGRRQFKIKSR